jgi:endogenous inhibitor of DNA gyrase (YacG/DUF329 family)
MPKCPSCGKEADPKYLPFCSARCKNIDLGRWLGEKYVIHTDETPEELPATGETDDEQKY